MRAPLPTISRVTFFALALVAGGCAGPTHTSDSFGRAEREGFAAQAAEPARKPPPPSMALDTQEAHVIAASYLQSLSGKAKEKAEPILMVDPQQQSTTLAPSVPRN
jgi:hypothetical protein